MTGPPRRAYRRPVSPHADWLRLVEVSGPFLSLPVLDRAFPQGMAPVPTDVVARLRVALDELRADRALGPAFIDFVLGEILGYDAASLATGPGVPPSLTATPTDSGETLRPSAAVLAGGVPVLLLRSWPAGTDLARPVPRSRWPATPVDRMVELCRATGVPLGLVTDGWRWAVVHAVATQPTGVLTFDADLWPEERPTLDAFADLLGAYRCYSAAESDTLPALLAASADAQTEVTDQLGRQVRAAVELLVDAMSRSDRETHGGPLSTVDPRAVYEGAVTVIMRLVFLLYAEEQHLFPLGDPLYDASYAVSTLLGQLQSDADRATEEVLERRAAAWPRVLAGFRLVHDGTTHDTLSLPAYGGSLFDPLQFPWLADLRVDDRTMLHILDALQVLRRRGRASLEALRLSYRSLDVEQIGYVYEGLLDHSALRAPEPHLALAGPKEPELPVAVVESMSALALADATGLAVARVDKSLAGRPDGPAYARLRAACDGDAALADRIGPYWGLLRVDLRGGPLVYPAGSVFVTQSGDRRSAGAHYTPRSLAEEVVGHTLDPLVHDPGPASGAPTAEWRLRPAESLLSLRVLDMAMGSGAFLVGACRYLAARVVEVWDRDGVPPEVPVDEQERLLYARRLVADRCLYGVDRDPMAVDMAKLSLWLVTLAKGRPFSFLDHALRRGDSLLGLTSVDSLLHLHPDPDRGRMLHSDFSDVTGVVSVALKDAAEQRRELESFPVLDIRDAADKARLHELSEQRTALLRAAADGVVAAMLRSSRSPADVLDMRLAEIRPYVVGALEGDKAALTSLRATTAGWLSAGRPEGAPERRPFHWPLEYPEVVDHAGGFDAVVGNPPFQGGQRITGAQGDDYRDLLVRWLAAGRRGSADLVSYFFLRAAAVAPRGRIGLLATNTIAQGDTREVGLDQLPAAGWSVVRAVKSRQWPGAATLEVSLVWLAHARDVEQRVLEGSAVPGITASLDPRGRVTGSPHRLVVNRGMSFIGSYVLGLGFAMPPEQAQALIARDPRNAEVLFPYLNGEDLNSRPDCSASRWVINFRDWSLERAATYPDLLAIVREKVKPERDRNNRANYRDYWWRYAEHRPGLYRAIAGLDRVLVIARVSKTVLPVFVPAGIVMSEQIAVFATEGAADLALLSSGLHYWWALDRGSTLETRIRYTPSDVFETFPRPQPTASMRDLGERLDGHRRDLMLGRHEGLTKTYNRVHNPAESAADIAWLRGIHVEIDHAVAAAYGWDDLDLDHGFHDTRQGTRYTIGPVARTEVLDRLPELNHMRHADEIRRGLHKPKKQSRGAGATGAGLF